ncbi:hypothetical protein Tco_0454366 [Tanacetum coccineum]
MTRHPLEKTLRPHASFMHKMEKATCEGVIVCVKIDKKKCLKQGYIVQETEDPRSQVIRLTCDPQPENNLSTSILNFVQSMEKISTQMRTSNSGTANTGIGADRVMYSLNVCDLLQMTVTYANLMHVETFSNLLYFNAAVFLDGSDDTKLLNVLKSSSLNFKYSTIEKATCSFDESNKLGEGGFGNYPVKGKELNWEKRYVRILEGQMFEYLMKTLKRGYYREIKCCYFFVGFKVSCPLIADFG